MIRREIRELIDLVKFDYEHSLSFIDGVVRVSIGIRTIAMAGCLALLVAAMQTEQAFLAGFSLLAAAALGAQDAYHGWLYAEARDHVGRMEALIDAYYRQIQGGASEARELQLLKRLRKHSIGSRPSLFGPTPPRSRARQAEWRGETTPVARVAAHLRIASLVTASSTVVKSARPRIVYALLYPLLAAISLAVVVVLLLGPGKSNDAGQAIRVCVACGARAEIFDMKGAPLEIGRDQR
jgi:hypothetical protein